MANLTPQHLERLADKLNAATDNHDWEQVKHIDLQLRKLLPACQAMPASAALQASLSQLKRAHQHALIALSQAREKLRQHLDSATEQKERLMAYQLAMDME